MKTKSAGKASGEKDCMVDHLKTDPAQAQARLLDLEKRLELETENRRKIEEGQAERFQLDRLLFELSARFFGISHDRVESEIQDALRRIMEFFQADRSGLVKLVRDGTGWQIAHAAFRDGLPDLPIHVDLPVDMFPIVFERITERHEIINYASLDEMPAEESIDKQSYQEWGIRSVVNIPIAVDGSLEYVFTMTSHHRERAWPPECFPQLRMLGEILVRCLQLSEAKGRLEERQKFESLVSEISGGFVIHASGNVENEIKNWLRRIANFFDTDRCGLKLFSEDGSRLDIAFEYHREEIGPACDFLSTDELPWYLGQLARGKSVEIHRLDDLPEEAEKERRFFTARKIKSILSVPMASGSRIMGTCSLVSVRKERVWPPELVQRMRFLAAVFAGALARNRMETQLRERLEEIERLKTRLETENIHLRKEIELQHVHKEIVGRSRAMKTLLAQIEQVAQTDATVLIEGETGAGKELMARAVHRLSTRKDRPLVTVNCASLPPTLIESELFGREKGAYTGAMTKMAGRFEKADGATLFLDEIGELPKDVQAKLLRVLEEGSFERLGSSKTLNVDVRIIAATNRDLAQEVAEGNFRNDLYYRLKVFPIVVPPLRERPEDIPLLVWAFVRQFEKKMGKRFDRISKKDMEDLMRCPWPGNVRELKNVVEHAMILGSGKTLEVRPPAKTFDESVRGLSLEDVEREHILGILRSTGWRISGEGGAAGILGLKRTTLQSKMKKLGIRRPS